MKLIICIAFAFAASEPPDVSGVWNLEMEWSSSGSRSTGVCTLKQDATKLSGTCADKSSVTGEVHDNTLRWQVRVDEDGQKGRMTFEGTLDDSGTTIRGTCAVVDGPSGTFTMTRR